MMDTANYGKKCIHNKPSKFQYKVQSGNTLHKNNNRTQKTLTTLMRNCQQSPDFHYNENIKCRSISILKMTAL